jgi:hypothetical protein
LGNNKKIDGLIELCAVKEIAAIKNDGIAPGMNCKLKERYIILIAKWINYQTTSGVIQPNVARIVKAFFTFEFCLLIF